MTSTSSEIEFPFLREQTYPIGLLREFERNLSSLRRSDRELSRQLRVPDRSAPAWMRLRNKELVPLRWLAEHLGACDEDLFALSAEGDAVDARIVIRGSTLKVQLTLAAPHWRGHGYQHHQVMRALNENDCVIGYPPYAIEGGIATGDVDVISSFDREQACWSGLSAAISNKLLFDGRGHVLAVFAQEFFMQLLSLSALQALLDSVLMCNRLLFDRVIVFDSEPGFYVERRPKSSGPTTGQFT